MTEEKSESKIEEKNKNIAMEKQPDTWAEAERKAKENAKEAERNLAVLDLKTSNIKELKNFVKAIDSLDELKLTIDKTGIHLWQLDPSGITMIIADLPKTLFSKWNVKPGTMGINTDKLKEAFKSIKNNSTLSIKTEKTKHLLNFILPDTNVEIPYYSIEKTIEKKEPDVEFTTEIRVPGQPLKEFINQAKKNYQYVFLLAKNKKLILFCKNSDGKLRKEIPLEKEVKEEAAVNFDLDYLSDLVKAVDKNTTNITIDMKTDHPMKLRYNNGFNVTYWIAPTVGENFEIKNQIKEAIKGIKQEKASVKKRLHS